MKLTHNVLTCSVLPSPATNECYTSKKPKTFYFHHVEGYQDPLIWARVKGGCQKYTNPVVTCKEYIPDDETTAAAADMEVIEALSEVDITAEGVPSMDDLLTPPRRLNPDPEDPRWADDAAAGVRGVVNMRSLVLVTLRCFHRSAKLCNSSTF